MPSRRILKKELNYLSNELINECLVFAAYHATVDENKVDDIIKKLMENKIEITHKINHVTKNKSVPAQKQYQEIYKQIEKDLIGSLDELKALEK